MPTRGVDVDRSLLARAPIEDLDSNKPQQRVQGKDGLHVAFTEYPKEEWQYIVVAKSERCLRQIGYTGPIVQCPASPDDPLWFEIPANSLLYFFPSERGTVLPGFRIPLQPDSFRTASDFLFALYPERDCKVFQILGSLSIPQSVMAQRRRSSSTASSSGGSER